MAQARLDWRHYEPAKHAPMTDAGSALRESICRVGRSLYERGYVHSTAGNISVRHGTGFIITAADACLGNLRPELLAAVDATGTQRSGEPASKTLALHRRIYASAPEAGCVIHTHSHPLVALTLQGVWRPDDILPPLTPYYVMKVGHVPLVPYHRPGDPQVAELVAGLIEQYAVRGTPIRAVMLDRLGPNVWHRTVEQASAVLEELEETARLWLACGREATVLTDPQIEQLRASFGAAW